MQITTCIPKDNSHVNNSQQQMIEIESMHLCFESSLSNISIQKRLSNSMKDFEIDCWTWTTILSIEELVNLGDNPFRDQLHCLALWIVCG
jgi:hypothetical protein